MLYGDMATLFFNPTLENLRDLAYPYMTMLRKYLLFFKKGKDLATDDPLRILE